MSLMIADVTTYLAAQGIGTAAVNLFYGIMDDTPDAQVVTFEYPGLMNEPNLGKTTANLVYPRIQVQARGIAYDYDGPRQKLQDVVTAFTKVTNQTIVVAGVSYKAIMALQDPFFLRRDANFRVTFACNFQITKEYSA